MKSLGGSRSLKFLVKKGISEIGWKRVPHAVEAPCLGGSDVGKFVIVSRATGLSKFGPSSGFGKGFAQNVV